MHFSFRSIGFLALAVAVTLASVGYVRERSHITQTTRTVLVTGDISFGEVYWLLPGLSSPFGLIQFSGSSYRARHTDLYLGGCIAIVPLSIPWLLGVTGCGLLGVLFLACRSHEHLHSQTHDPPSVPLSWTKSSARRG